MTFLKFPAFSLIVCSYTCPVLCSLGSCVRKVPKHDPWLLSLDPGIKMDKLIFVPFQKCTSKVGLGMS